MTKEQEGVKLISFRLCCIVLLSERISLKICSLFSFRLLLKWEQFFEFLLHDSRKANATQVIGDLAPFVWRAKQMFCVTSSPRPIDSRVDKIFSFNGSRLFTVRLSSVLCYCIEIQFEIVDGMVSNIFTDQQGKICVCIGRCFEIICKAYTVCFYNFADHETMTHLLVKYFYADYNQ